MDAAVPGCPTAARGVLLRALQTIRVPGLPVAPCSQGGLSSPCLHVLPLLRDTCRGFRATSLQYCLVFPNYTCRVCPSKVLFTRTRWT